MQLTIFDAIMASHRLQSSGKTSLESSQLKTTHSDASWAQWSEAMIPSFHQDGPDGRTRVWLMDPKDAPHGGASTPSTSAWPSDGSGFSCSLAEVLIRGDVPMRYFLSSTACAGILRRAENRDKTLPAALLRALKAVADSNRGGDRPDPHG